MATVETVKSASGGGPAQEGGGRPARQLQSHLSAHWSCQTVGKRHMALAILESPPLQICSGGEPPPLSVIARMRFPTNEVEAMRS